MPKEKEEVEEEQLEKENSVEPLFPFGMPVSNEEIKKLLKTIPPST